MGFDETEKNYRDNINILKTKLHEGIEIGKQKKAIEIAKNLLDVLDVKTIAENTGLTIEEVKELKNKS
jgi:predicted transposase/invertase (TIGR01784 family)